MLSKDDLAAMVRAKGVSDRGLTPGQAKAARDRLRAIFGPAVVKGSDRRLDEIVAATIVEAEKLKQG